jgi:nitronate monooxygenase
MFQQFEWPVIQAPMAGVSTPAMAAAVAAAGGVGSLGVGAMSPAQARAAIGETRARAAGRLNVNVFCHAPARRDEAREQAWLARLRPAFAEVGAQPPAGLAEIYKSFLDDPEMLAVLVETRPEIVSFHFGLPRPGQVAALRAVGCALVCTATSLEEASAAAAAGMDAVVAQGWEAGGHRGTFDPDAEDTRLGSFALTRVLVRALEIPVIAAGGIMDGAGVAAALRLGAVAAQLGTAFVAAEESAAEPAYRAALLGAPARHTVMTRAISGRPARCLANRFTAVAGEDAPAYPVAYDAGKALHAAAKAKGDHGYGAYWAGQGAPLARALPVARLIAALKDEMR